MAEFTPTQGRYLSFIKAYIGGFNIAPAESEISQALKVSPPSVNQMMRTLEEKGVISRQKGVARSIEIKIPLDSIPKWKGRAITRTVYEWVKSPASGFTRRPASGQVSKLVDDDIVYRFKVTLSDTQPPIWREIETRDVSLGELHKQIQAAMGWTNSHLHQFRIDGKNYTDGRMLEGEDFATDYAGMRMSDLVAEHGQKLSFEYEYDFGDSWDHDIVLEGITSAVPKQKYPLCTTGAGACPPEDVGGVPGFYDYVEAISDQAHPQHEEYLEWHGPFDPEKFDSKKASIRMRKGL